MNIELSQEQLMLKDTARLLVRKEFNDEMIRAMIQSGDDLSLFESKLTNIGISGICFPERYGGEDLNIIDVAVVIEALSRYSIDMGMTCGINLTAGIAILRYGSEFQRKNWLTKLISGKASACFGSSEPFAFNRMQPATVKDVGKDEVEIRLPTVFCENKPPKTALLFLPVTVKGESTLAILPLKELEIGDSVATVGRKLLGQCRIPAQVIRSKQAQLLDPHPAMMQDVTNTLKFFNVMSIVGNMKTVVERTIEYAKAREQFGRPIGTFQSIAHLIVDAKIGLDSSILYGYWLAWLLAQQNGDSSAVSREANLANTFVSQSFIKAVNTAIQVMGGYGYMNESHMERYARDARMTTFYVQDSYAQKMAIANGFTFDWF